MKYDDALRLWGARRLEATESGDVIPDTVEVRFEYEEEWDQTYGNGLQSARATVVITGEVADPDDTLGFFWSDRRTEIEPDEFDFAAVLKEIIDIGGGSISE